MTRRVISADHSGYVESFDGTVNERELRKAFNALKDYTQSDEKYISCDYSHIKSKSALDKIARELINGERRRVNCALKWEGEYDPQDEYETEDRWTSFYASRRSSNLYNFSGSTTSSGNSLISAISSFKNLKWKEEHGDDDDDDDFW